MLDGLLDIFRAENALDRQIEMLEALSDRELADLGLARDQIEAFVRGTVGSAD